MAGTDYSFEGLDKLEQQLSRMIEQEYPAEFEKMVLQVAYELQGKVKEKTPKKTGRLQDSWKVGKIQRLGGEYYIEVYTNVDYAEPVEYGHRQEVGRYVPAIGKRLVAPFVPGKHMMQLSLEEVAAYLPGYLQEWLDDFISTHDL